MKSKQGKSLYLSYYYTELFSPHYYTVPISLHCYNNACSNGTGVGAVHVVCTHSLCVYMAGTYQLCFIPLDTCLPTYFLYFIYTFKAYDAILWSNYVDCDFTMIYMVNNAVMYGSVVCVHMLVWLYMKISVSPLIVVFYS